MEHQKNKIIWLTVEKGLSRSEMEALTNALSHLEGYQFIISPKRIKPVSIEEIKELIKGLNTLVNIQEEKELGRESKKRNRRSST